MINLPLTQGTTINLHPATSSLFLLSLIILNIQIQPGLKAKLPLINLYFKSNNKLVIHKSVLLLLSALQVYFANAGPVTERRKSFTTFSSERNAICPPGVWTCSTGKQSFSDKLLLRTKDSASKSSCPPGVWTCSTGKQSHIPDRQFPAIAVTVFQTIMKLMVAETQPTHHYVSRRVETTKCSRGWSRKEHLQSRPSKPEKLLALQAFGHVRLENDKGVNNYPAKVA